MALVVTHATVATDPQVPLLDHTDWNANHAIAGVADASQLGTGTANTSTFLRGDGTWTNELISSSATAFALRKVAAGTIGFSVDMSAATLTQGVKITPGNAQATIGASSAGNTALTINPSGTGNITLGTGNTGAGAARLLSAAGFIAQVGPSQFSVAPQANGTTASRFLYTSSADSGMTASTEGHAVDFNFAGATRNHATGALAEQRDFRIRQQTHSFAAASTLSKASTHSVDGAPIAGTNATITRAYAYEAKTGVSYFGDGIILKDSASALWKLTVDTSGVLQVAAF